MDLIDLAARIGIFFIPFLFALCFHELAHGWVARLRGDHTAEHMGRLTMNPLAHADPIGTFALPLAAIAFSSPIFFGWAKPVPVNPRNLMTPRSDMFWIALAGPLSNVLLAFVGAVLLGLSAHVLPLGSYQPAIIRLLDIFIFINLILAVFNMIPIHPLDGGKVLARFLPDELNQKMEENEMILGMLLLVLILSGVLRFLLWPALVGHEVLRNIALYGGI